MDIIKQLNWRYATKRFSEIKIDDKTLETILESARLTATSYGLQAYKILVVEDKQLRKELSKHSFDQPQIEEASHLLIICRYADISNDTIKEYADRIVDTRQIDYSAIAPYADKMRGSIKSKSREEREIWLARQAYIVLGNILTTCAMLMVDSCPMEGFNNQEYDRILKLDEKDLKSVLAIPIGYRSEMDPLQNAAKVRRNRDAVIEWL